MSQDNKGVRTVKQLSSIFPDIDGELCSRHSSVMGKLKLTFNKLYDSMIFDKVDMDPQRYVIVKGTAEIVKTDQTSLSFALENGIILMVTKTFPTSNVFLNGNHIDQEIIFSHTGHIQEGLHELNSELSETFKLAIKNINPSQLFGGIIYLHANIPQDFFTYKDSFLLAFYISILIFNGKIEKITIQDIIQELLQSRIIQNTAFLERQFYDFDNRNFCLSVANQNFKIPFQKKLKFVLCRLALAPCDIQYIEKKKELDEKTQKQILNDLKQQYPITNFCDILQNQLQFKDFKTTQQKSKVIMQVMKQLKSICDFSNKQIGIQQLLANQWHINEHIRQLYPEEVLDLIYNIKQKTGIQNCVLIEKQFLLFTVDKSKFAELICTLRQFLMKGELKSKSCFQIDDELIENRWGSSNDIGEKIFASAPSSGVTIFDPTQAIWFD